MRYVKARIENENRVETYRFYVTEALKIITGNSARLAGGNELQVSYHDLISKAFSVKETRTSDEIISAIKEKLSKAGE